VELNHNYGIAAIAAGKRNDKEEQAKKNLHETVVSATPLSVVREL
jgi:hypothetical protein